MGMSLAQGWLIMQSRGKIKTLKKKIKIMSICLRSGLKSLILQQKSDEIHDKEIPSNSGKNWNTKIQAPEPVNRDKCINTEGIIKEGFPLLPLPANVHCGSSIRNALSYTTPTASVMWKHTPSSLYPIFKGLGLALLSAHFLSWREMALIERATQTQWPGWC